MQTADMPSQQELEQQQALLEANRGRLAVYLRQQATLGEAYAPPGVITGIEETRNSIRRIKETLRKAGPHDADHPDDESSVQQAGTKQGKQAIRSRLGENDSPWSLATALHQLRVRVSDFVGRDVEIEQVVQALNRTAEGGAAA